MDEDVIDYVHRILGRGKNAIIRNEYVSECFDAEGAAIAYPQPVKPKLIRIYMLLGGNLRDN